MTAIRANYFAIFLFLPALGFGSLQWDTQRIEATAQQGENTVTGIFHFVNSGTASITIISVQPSCGCTTAEISKRDYAPEEAGEIKAVFTVGDREGVQEKTILVTTEDAPTEPISLMLRVTIPELLTFSSRQLLWQNMEEPTEKSIIVTNTSPHKIAEIEHARTSSSSGTIRIETAEPGVKYRVFVRPASTANKATFPFLFTARFADKTIKKFQLYAEVK